MGRPFMIFSYIFIFLKKRFSYDYTFDVSMMYGLEMCNTL